MQLEDTEICNCPSQSEIECISDGGMWSSGGKQEINAGICELPSEDELACMQKFGTWETFHITVDGLLKQTKRKDGFCLTPEEAEYDCITGGGFWQYGHWENKEWKNGPGQCSMPPEYTKVSNAKNEHYSHSY